MVGTRAGVDLTSLKTSNGSNVYRAEYEARETSPSMAVIAVLADSLDIDPTEMDPLYPAVNTEALDELLRHRSEADEVVQVSFSTSGRNVTVSSDGQIEVSME